MTDTFDPSDATAAEVNEYLSSADDAERERVLAAEEAGQSRKSVMEGEYGPADPAPQPGDVLADGEAPEGTRTDASGRVLYDWEADPADIDPESGENEQQ